MYLLIPPPEITHVVKEWAHSVNLLFSINSIQFINYTASYNLQQMTNGEKISSARSVVRET